MGKTGGDSLGARKNLAVKNLSELGRLPYIEHRVVFAGSI